jgi:hypothetical protein
MNRDPIENFEIIYPEESTTIISNLMEKYGLKETVKDIEEKMDRGEITNGEKIARIVAEAAENDLSIEDISALLEKRLAITKEICKKLAEDLKKEILIFIKKTPIKETEVEKEEKLRIKTETSSKTPPISQKKDIYREPIE